MVLARLVESLGRVPGLRRHRIREDDAARGAALPGPTRERLVVVEDAGELAPHPHVVRLEARPAMSRGAGAIALTDLVRQALRMRPDRIVVGEVRGAEVRDCWPR